MRFHPEELALAQRHAEEATHTSLTTTQLGVVRKRARELAQWTRDHRKVHTALNLGVIFFLLGADAAVLLALPAWLPEGAVAIGVTGLLHGWLMYSLTVFSLHEGGAHGLIFPGRPAWGRLATELSRLAGADPVQYREAHASHHGKFGTEEDGEFLSFVQRGRFFRSLLPYGAYLNHSDFVAHRDVHFNRSQALSVGVSTIYALVYGIPMAWLYGWLLPAVVLGVMLPHVAFYLDRLRQFTEHNQMPLDNNSGSRSFGLGFWGMLVGGGPWGQPCHWIHHLAPSLPWYQQLRLHCYVANRLTREQRRQHLLQPVVGFPLLLWQLLRLSAAENGAAQRGGAIGERLNFHAQ